MTKVLGSLDSRTRVIAGLALVITAAVMQTWTGLLMVAALELSAARVTGAHPKRLIRALLLTLWLGAGLLCVLPFVTAGSRAVWHIGAFSVGYSRTGVSVAFRTALRLATCAVAATVLRETTPPQQIIAALEWLRVPSLMTQLTAMTLRYIDVLADEVERMTVSRRSRCQPQGRWLWDGSLRSTAQTIGALLLRALNRSERIHNAMLARGYSLQTRRRLTGLNTRDRLAIGATMATLVAVVAVDLIVRGA